MQPKRSIEVFLTGLAAHSGCLLACFGAGVVGMQPGCRQAVEAGHPLAYLASQAAHLFLAVLAVWLYRSLKNSTYRLPFVVILSGLLWAPSVGSYASVALQAIFLFQMVGLLLGARGGRSRLCCEPARSNP